MGYTILVRRTHHDVFMNFVISLRSALQITWITYLLHKNSPLAQRAGVEKDDAAQPRERPNAGIKVRSPEWARNAGWGHYTLGNPGGWRREGG